MAPRALLAAITFFALVAACGDGTGDGADEGGTVRVFAASSLTEAFTELQTRFERSRDRTKVELTFAGSPALARQIVDGAPADVFASADEATMQTVVDAGYTDGEPAVFAHNRLAVVVERGNPEGIAGIRDLPRHVVVMCAPEVPCGRLGAELLQVAGVTLEPASFEDNVKAVVGKVALGEADAGIVFATDARAAAATTDTVAIDVERSPNARYEIAVTRDARPARAARAWVAFVRGAEGQRVLSSFGFLAPT